MSAKQREGSMVGVNGRVCEGECMGCSLTLTRCHSCGLPQLYEAFEDGSPFVAKTTT